MIPLQVNPGPKINQRRKPRIAQKRSSEANAMLKTQLVQQTRNNHQSLNNENNKKSPVKNMNYPDSKSQSPDQFQFPQISNQQQFVIGRNQVASAHHIQKVLINGAESQEQLLNRLQSMISNRSQRRYSHLRDGGASKDLPPRSGSIQQPVALNSGHRMSFLNTETTQTSFKITQRANKSMLNNAKMSKELLMRTSSQQNTNDRKKARTKLEIESELHDPNRTFEVAVGG